MNDSNSFEACARQLLGLPISEFVAARNEMASALKGDGRAVLAKRVAGLRKPSAAAGAVNRLASQAPASLERLVDVGVRLRDAQADGDRDGFRALDGERRKVMREVAAEAADGVEESGGSLSVTARSELEDSLRAAMADEGAAVAVRSGLLVRALQSDGFGPVDLSGSVAVPEALPETARPNGEPGPHRGRRRPSAAALNKATKTARRAQQNLEDSSRELVSRQRDRKDLQALVEKQEAEVEAATQRLEVTRGELERTEQAVSAAESVAEAMEARATEAREVLEGLG